MAVVHHQSQLIQACSIRKKQQVSITITLSETSALLRFDMVDINENYNNNW